MTTLRIIFENNYLTKNVLLSYYDLVVNHIIPYAEYYENNTTFKSQNKSITLDDFKNLTKELRTYIDNLNQDPEDGSVTLNVGNTKFALKKVALYPDLEESNDIDYSDSIFVDSQQIVITFTSNNFYTGDFESGGYFEVGSEEKELWKKLNDGFLIIQTKDSLGEYCDDFSAILGIY